MSARGRRGDDGFNVARPLAGRDIAPATLGNGVEEKRSGMSKSVTGGAGFIGSHLVDALVERGYEVKLIIEGSACKQIEELDDTDKPFSNLYRKVKELGILDCVCKACSNKMETHESAVSQDLNLCGELGGHPSIARYMDDGYEILTF